MTPERGERIRTLFLQAAALDGDERRAFLEGACGEDADLRREVEQLLDHDEADTQDFWTKASPLRIEPTGPDEELSGQLYGQPIPHRIGEYEILRPIGAGGMGSVYLARQTSLGREVAVKLVHPGMPVGEETLKRFLGEARAAARVEHTSIVSVLEAGVDGGRPFIAMQLVRGVSLQEVLVRGGRLPPERALGIVRDIALAVQAAHDAGVVHRDIKPGNILVEGDAQSAREKGRVYLGDFGIAVLTDVASLTPSANLLGTPAYMSPEQARGEKVGKLSDVYSLGATLYALLSGRAPHEGTSYLEVVARVAHEDPIPLARLVPSVSRDATLVCEKAMRWEARRRYGSAAELAVDSDRCLSRKPISARPASFRYRAGLWVKRNPRAVRIAAIVALTACLAFLVERGIRRDGILDLVEQKVREQSFAEARTMLGELPRVPLPRGVRREANVRLQVALGNLDLSGAAVAAAQLEGPERREALSRLRLAVEDALDGAEAFFVRKEIWRTPLLDLRNVAGGIVRLESEGLAPELPREWLEDCCDRVFAAGETILLDRRLDEEAQRLREAQRKGGAKAKTDLPEVYTTLGGVLKVPDEPSRYVPREADKLVALLPDQDRDAPGQGGDGPASTTSLLRAVVDDYLPLLDTLPRRRAVFTALMIECLRPIGLGAPARLGVPAAQDVGDCDGDSLSELVVATAKGEIEVLRWTLSGLRKLSSAPIDPRADGVPCPRSVSLQDVDGDGRLDIIVFYHPPGTEGLWNRPAYLRAFSVKEDGSAVPLGVEYPPPGETKLQTTVFLSSSVLVMADPDEDGGRELVLGTSSSGDDERSVWVIEKPFTPDARRSLLPSGGQESDVTSVFCADVDGDGRPEVGCVTGPWKGFDIRFWKHDAASKTYKGPLSFGPFGMFGWAISMDLDAAPGQELFLAKSASYEPNTVQFPLPPHLGLQPGVYVFRLPEGSQVQKAEVRVDASRWEKHFLWSDRLNEEISFPRDQLYPALISAGEWASGRVVAVSWDMLQRGNATHFIDLYSKEDSRDYTREHAPAAVGPRSLQLTRTRLFHRESPGGLFGHVVRLGGGKGKGSRPGILTVEWAEEKEKEATAVVTAWAPPVLGATRIPPPSAAEWTASYLRTEKYAEAMALAKERLSSHPSEEESRSLSLDWARGAARDLDWDSAREALDYLRQREGGPKHPPASEGAGGLDEEMSLLESIVERARRLLLQPVVNLSLEGQGHKPVGATSMGGPGLRRVALSEETITVSRPSDVAMSFELRLEKIGWNQSIAIGLYDAAALPAEGEERDIGGSGSNRDRSYAVRIAKNGGGGQELIQPDWIWPGVGPLGSDPSRLLKEGSEYRFTLIRTAEARLRLKVEELGARGTRAGARASGSPSRVLSFASPPYDETKLPAGQRGIRESAEPLRPLPAGYRFAIYERTGLGGAREASLRPQKIKVQILAIPEEKSEPGGK